MCCRRLNFNEVKQFALCNVLFVVQVSLSYTTPPHCCLLEPHLFTYRKHS